MANRESPAIGNKGSRRLWSWACLRWVGVCSVVLLAGSWEAAEARSTVVARFAGQGIAGPGVAQHLNLYLYYFPGDGEAIRRAEVSYDQQVVQVTAARSSLGKVAVAAGVVQAEYETRPLGRECVDTLALDLVGRRAEIETRWQARIFSSGDSSGIPAHTFAFALRVQEPVRAEVRLSPARVFAGEQVQLELLLTNIDHRGRAIEAAAWDWPAGVTVEEGAGARRWDTGLRPGQADTLRVRVRLSQQAAGPLFLRGNADAEALIGSPLPETALQVTAAPLLRVRAGTEWLEVDSPARLQCEWTNPGPDSLQVAELQVEIPGGFEEVALAGPAERAQLVAPQAGQKGSLRLLDPRTLGPGQTIRVDLSAKARRPGLFAWKGSFRPNGDRGPIPLGGEALVRVARAAGDRGDSGSEAEGLLTDLELVSLALAESVDRALSDLPLFPGAVVCPGADEQGSDNWLVEDVLAASLMRQGFQVVSGAPAGLGPAVRVRYRLADVRVVYDASATGWNPLHARTGREAYADLFLRLEEPGRQVRWARRAQAYRADQVPAAAAEWLGGSEVVKRTVVAPDHRMVTRLLSGSILGGLAYIFLMP